MRKLLATCALSCVLLSAAASAQWREIHPVDIGPIEEIQSALLWTGYYNGPIDGRLTPSTTTAMQRFQTAIGGRGDFTPSERAALLAAGKSIRNRYGYSVVNIPSLNARIGYPTALLKRVDTEADLRTYSGEDGTRLDIYVSKVPLERLYQSYLDKAVRVEIDHLGRDRFFLKGMLGDFKFQTRVVQTSNGLTGYSFRYPSQSSERYNVVAKAIEESFTQIDPNNPIEGDISRYFQAVNFVEKRGNSYDAVNFFKDVSASVFTIVPMIYAEKNDTSSSQASAVAISPDLFVTNCHAGGNNGWINYALYQNNARVGAAKIIAADELSDRCILQRTDGLPVMPIRGIRLFSSLNVGETVFSIGSPSGYDRTLGQGIISGLRLERKEKWVQTTAPIDRGSSGGGLFDSSGYLIGVTTFFVKDSQNLNFAISIERPG